MDASALKKVAEAANTFELATSDRSNANSARNSMSALQDPLRSPPTIDTGVRPLFGEIGSFASSMYQPFKPGHTLPDPRGASSSLNDSQPASQGGTAPISPLTCNDQIATSPKLRPYAIPHSQRPPQETLPAMQHSPPASTASPRGRQSLPSLSAHLGPLADGAAMPVSTNLPPPTHRASFPNNSAALHSPAKDQGNGRVYNPLHPSRNSTTPYMPIYTTTEPSPTSTSAALSPREYRPIGPNNPLTRSPPSALGHPNPLTRSPPSTLKYPPSHQAYPPSTSMTPQSDVQTPLSATTQHSAHTLSSGSSPQNDTGSDTGTPRTLLPPSQTSLVGSNALVNGGYKCDHPGCKAAPFQTQYLLNSHANVHSQNRPHYCPVKTCSRSEGGKGFKRKNEMIRHGLVHQSPGYICPFCPEREHKYPRPDNLQRHVRVHHLDKDKDDPQLRDVLSQRPEGGSRGRRRRVNS